MLNPHIIRKPSSPVAAPPEAGIHWINTVTNEEFFSVGTASVGDWIPRAAAPVDFTDLNDVPSSYVGQSLKAVRVNVGETGLEFVAGGASDELVKVSSNDTTAKYLEAAIVVAHGTNTSTVLELSTLNDGGNEDLQISFDVSKVDLSNANNTTSDFASKSYADGKVADAINNGTTTIAPSQNAVFDALALKYDASNPSNFIDAAGAKAAAVADSITNGVVDIAPSQNAVYDALALKYDASNPSSYIDASGAVTAIVSSSITNGVTNKSPSEDAVFDALALKEDLTNKAVDFTTVNNTLYPTVQAVAAYVSSTSLSGGIYVFSSVNSDISGYESAPALNDFVISGLASVTQTVTTSPTLMEEFATPSAGLGITVLPAGLYTVHYDAQKSSGANNYFTYAEIYKRTSGGTETLLATSDVSASTSVNTQISITVTALTPSSSTLNLTDRLVVKIYFQMVSGSQSINILYDDATAARVQLPSSSLPYTPENVANKSTDGTLADNSTILYPSQSAVKTYADAKVADAINNGTTTIAPSQNAVFDALALKYDASNPSSYIDAAGAVTAVVSSSITNGVTNKSPSEDAVFDALALKYDASNPSSYIDAAGAVTAVVSSSITNGVTNKSPSEDAVFDALALKYDASNPSSYVDAAGAKTAAVSDVAYDSTTWNGVTDVAPSKNAVRDQVETMNTSISAKAAKAGDTFTGAVIPSVVTLTDAATIAVNATLGNQFTVTLGGNRTLGNPTGAVNGQLMLFAIRQDGTGSRTLAFDTKFRFGTDITAITLTTAINKTDYIGVRYHSADDKFDIISVVRGY